MAQDWFEHQGRLHDAGGGLRQVLHEDAAETAKLQAQHHGRAHHRPTALRGRLLHREYNVEILKKCNFLYVSHRWR